MAPMASPRIFLEAPPAPRLAPQAPPCMLDSLSFLELPLSLSELEAEPVAEVAPSPPKAPRLRPAPTPELDLPMLELELPAAEASSPELLSLQEARVKPAKVARKSSDSCYVATDRKVSITLTEKELSSSFFIRNISDASTDVGDDFDECLCSSPRFENDIPWLLEANESYEEDGYPFKMAQAAM